eukprot:gnl/TRDRNA2_/TRDRNA2_64983_c0_seq1.p2 gnl/TRDRNA2_/TRDRNA2_64983_c0~~gnl/TRDRNA2_/TRDRNA2_64983_c0_seq1.p2  ORF type:complete len:144 (+),score=19.07 gnl/TRDRNA2_/TRDRNA2_64983_c0_seq1:56-487(+)
MATSQSLGKSHASTNSIRVEVVTLSGDLVCCFYADPAAAVRSAKAQIEKICAGDSSLQCPMASQRLVAANNILADKVRLRTLCPEGDTSPELVLTLVLLPEKIRQWLSELSEILSAPLAHSEDTKTKLHFFKDADENIRECFE